jgi:hypothetical protein
MSKDMAHTDAAHGGNSLQFRQLMTVERNLLVGRETNNSWLRTTNIRIQIFWGVAPYRLVMSYQRFERT